MKIIDAFKTFGKDDLKFIIIPIIALILFLIIVVIIFPKPSKIYKDGELKSCRCMGFKSIPRETRGSFVGDEYCFGVPYSCEKIKILRKNN